MAGEMIPWVNREESRVEEGERQVQTYWSRTTSDLEFSNLAAGDKSREIGSCAWCQRCWSPTTSVGNKPLCVESVAQWDCAWLDSDTTVMQATKPVKRPE